MAALMISNKGIHYEAPFMKSMLKRPPPLGKDFSNATKALLFRVFRKVQTEDLSKNFGKGYAFDLICVTEFILIAAIVLIIFEHFCARRSGDDDYKSELISDGYNLPEKGAPSSVEM